MDKRFNTDGVSRAALIGCAGIVVAVFTVIASVSFAELIFSGPINGFVAIGIRMALTTAVIVGVMVALTSSCRGAIAIPQDRVVPILAILASGVIIRMPDASPEERGLTLISAIIIVTLITGLFLYGLGQFRLGNIVRYIPYPVIGGFLAGSGWLLAIGGIRVMTGHAVNLQNLPILVSTASLWHWLPGVLFGLCLYGVFRRGLSPLYTPGLLLLAIGLFYGVTALLGLSATELRAREWLPALASGGETGGFTVVSVLRAFSWELLLNNVGILATILLTSVVSILLTASALELSAQHDIDLNRELRAAGAGTFLSGLAGGMVGFHSLSMSRLALSLGAHSRWVGIISAVCCAVVIWVGPGFVSFVPLFVCGGLLFFLGAIFLGEWVHDARRKLTRLDYAVVLLILAVVGVVGYPEGVAVGIVAAVVLFVHNYSRVEVVSHVMSGAHLRSNVERAVRDIRYLREHGEQIYVLRLQGFIFFGTANHLLNQVRARAMDTQHMPLRFVVMDVRRVTGIDSSAVFSLWKVHELARKHGFTLVMTNVSDDARKQLATGGLHPDASPSFRLFPDLDHGMEWCEAMILSAWHGHNNGGLSLLQEQLKEIWPKDVPPDRLMAYLEPMRVEKGSHIIRQAEQSESLYFIESGQVTARLELDNGRFLRLSTMGPGTVVGEVGLFLGGQRMASVVAEQPCTVYRLTAQQLENMRCADPSLALAFHQFIVRLLAERLTTTSGMLRSVQE